jgi:hypothetical protein
MVAAEALTGLQSIAAFSLATNELVLGLTLHRAFADHTALAIKAGMATASAEGFARIGYRRRQLGTAAGVAAHLPRLLSKFSQCNLEYENPSALLRAGLVRVGNLVWSNQAERSAIEPR